MDPYGQRPPRQPRPGVSSGYSSPSSPPYPDQYPTHYSSAPRPPPQPVSSGHPNVSFQTSERGDRNEPLDHPSRLRTVPSAYTNILPTTPDAEGGYELGDGAMVGRKKSLVKPDREKIEPGHRQWHYRNHAARLEEDGVIPSSETFFLNCIQFVVEKAP